jgi:hypothetical protein
MEIDHTTIIVGYFKNSPSTAEKSCSQKINKEKLNLRYTSDEWNMTNT